MKLLFSVCLCIISLLSSSASNLFIEAESFTKKGGWVVDQQFMDLMGSSYLMAHGMGEPVEDAPTGLLLGKMEKDRENSACMSVIRSWLHLWDAKEIHGCGKQQGK